MSFAPRFTVTNLVTAALTRIERARWSSRRTTRRTSRARGSRAISLIACSPAGRCPRPTPTTCASS